ncbi:MAG: hypothetical protein ACI9Y7_001755, partial [Dokdonia sp.]
MKQFLLSIGFLFSFFIGYGQCPDPPNGFLNFFTQEDVDNFLIEYPNCTELNLMRFIVEGEGIHNLDAFEQSQLSNITVAYSFEIINTSLTTLSGFQNINITTNPNASVRIRHNELLSSLDGLERLDPSDGLTMLIRHNTTLVEVDALSGMTTNIISLFINSNPVLESIDGLRNISTSFFTSYVEIESNPMLSDCAMRFVCERIATGVGGDDYNVFLNGAECDFMHITEACMNCGTEQIILNTQSEINDFSINYPDCIGFNYGVVIEGSDITDLAPLQEIVSITDGLAISNTSLESLEGLSGLQNVDEILLINNPLLTDISEFEDISIAKLTHLEIVDNVQLNSCALPPFCTYLNEGGEFTITNNGVDCN